jgi:elongation factor 1 alpha-like protein
MVRFYTIYIHFLHSTLPADRPTAQMIDGLEQVRNVLGDQGRSGFPDQAIKDALWEFYFDVDKSVVYLLGASYRLHRGRVR